MGDVGLGSSNLVSVYTETGYLEPSRATMTPNHAQYDKAGILSFSFLFVCAVRPKKNEEIDWNLRIKLFFQDSKTVGKSFL